MSSTLFIRKTPKPPKEAWHFKLPVKSFVGRKYYDHDGSSGGGMITVGPEDLAWWEGILVAASLDDKERKELTAVVEILRDGGSIDLWFES